MNQSTHPQNNSVPQAKAVHPKLVKFFETYKINTSLAEFLEVFIEMLYGQLLLAIVASVTTEDGLKELNKHLDDPSIPEEVKGAALLKTLADHTEFNPKQLYDDFVEFIGAHLEKNIRTVIELYNKSVKESKTKEEMISKFSEYMQTLEDMKIANIEDKFNIKVDR